MTRLTKVFALSFLVAALAFGQASNTTTSTTLSAAQAASTGLDIIRVASATNIAAPSQPTTVGTTLFVDGEAERVIATTGVTTTFQVQRGVDGTTAAPHASGAKVWVGRADQGQFSYGPPTQAPGSCTASNFTYLPVIDELSGDVWDCPYSGSSNGIWTRTSQGKPTTVTKTAWVPCTGAVSGNSTGTNGFSTVGTNAVGVYNLQTSASGTNTHNYICYVPGSALGFPQKGVSISKVVFSYGVQTTALGTQTATLASGLMNSVQVFSFITLPTPAASESASSNTLTRADSGTLTITPVVGSFNTATTTAGTFYSVAFTPATPFAYNTDLQLLQVTVPLLNTATSATITNSPGALVYFTDNF